MVGGLGNLHRDRAGRRVDALGLVAIGIALASRAALVEAGAEKPLALDAHRQLESPREHGGDVVGSMFDQMFQKGLDRRILLTVHSTVSTVGSSNPWNTGMDRPRRGMPLRGARSREQRKVQTSGYSTRAAAGRSRG